jgi:hypothetical protein
MYCFIMRTALSTVLLHDLQCFISSCTASHLYRSFIMMYCVYYTGMWRGQAVAVKIVTHTSSEAPRITRELSLAQQLDHPHLVKTLHFARMTLNNTGAGSPVVRGAIIATQE